MILFSIKTGFAQSRNVEYYKNGQNGIELIYKSKTSTIIISTYNAKIALKKEVAQNLYEFVKQNPTINDSLIDVKTDQAIVKGRCKVIKKNSLTSLNFYYKQIEWFSGLVEEYLK
ncbi:MAG: hypothetical protein H7174_12640 [Flavobacterium sp.]|nr:hypothetical protein [Flavobacterium sp.]